MIHDLILTVCVTHQAGMFWRKERIVSEHFMVRRPSQHCLTRRERYPRPFATIWLDHNEMRDRASCSGSRSRFRSRRNRGRFRFRSWSSRWCRVLSCRDRTAAGSTKPEVTWHFRTTMRTVNNDWFCRCRWCRGAQRRSATKAVLVVIFVFSSTIGTADHSVLHSMTLGLVSTSESRIWQPIGAHVPAS